MLRPPRPPPPPMMQAGRRYGFLTDGTLCIGCKACEVACKQWNALPAEDFDLKASSYDHTGRLGATTWRHVKFVEEIHPDGPRWLFLSDVCKHCVRAGCLEACPTGAIVRTEFDTVYIQPDVCNGCGYCVPACPFGVVEVDHSGDGLAHKCTLCYDRLKGSLEPACAKACPTDSIVFGEVDELLVRARERVETLAGRGVAARVYGDPDDPGMAELGGLNCLFVTTTEPGTFNLPTAPRLPARSAAAAARVAALVSGAIVGAGAIAFALTRRR